MKYIPVFDIKLGSREKKYVNLCLKNSWLGQGQYVEKFEKKLCRFVGTKFCVSTSSGTTALHLACASIDLTAGDEVLVSSSTNMASVFSIIYCGAKPIPVDISKENWQLKFDDLKKKITKKTKAILPVHWAGKICDMNLINKISKKYSIPVVEDACHAILSKKYGKFAGSFGKMGCFSLHPLKNLNVWGDGGFIVTNKKSLAEKLYLIRNHGLKNRDNVEVFGFNSRLDTIQAAVANYKMKNKLDNITIKRIRNATKLDKLLSANENVTTVKRMKHLKEVFHLYHINVDKRDLLQKYLIKNNIDAKVHYPIPVHLQKAARYLKYKKGDFPTAEKMANTSLSLPVHEFIDERHIKHMVNSINNFYNK